MNQTQIKTIIKKLCVDVFGSKAPLSQAPSLDELANILEQKSEQYHVDLRLAIAQGVLECHFGHNPAAARSRKTKNIYNVGNVDDGGNRFFASWEDGISAYFRLMAREYCWRNEGPEVTAEMMIAHDFTRPRGGRYATAPSYTKDIASIVKKIDSLLK